MHMAGTSGCAFCNSLAICNNCGIQIVHSQVQEHAQNCPGLQPQAQQADGAWDTSASGTSAIAEQTQAATQSGIATSQAEVFQTTSVTPPGSDPNQKANSSSQAVVQAAEQRYQHQQQYQQHYRQYPGYDPCQQQYQNYAAVQQSQKRHLQSHPPCGTVQHQPRKYLQSQPQTQHSLRPQLSQSQAQPQPQIQPPHVQVPVAAQTQNLAQVNKQPQLHRAAQTYPAAHRQPHPQPLQYFQAPSHSKPHPQRVQLPHNQQAKIQQHTQSQLAQSQAQPQPQIQPPHVQVPVAAQTQNLAQVNKQQQLHPAVQTYPAACRQPHPQPLQYFQAPFHSKPHPQRVQLTHNQQAKIQQHTQSQLSQSQAQPQPQTQPPHVQVPVAALTQNLAQVNKQQQLHPAVQTYPAARRQPHPQPLQYFQAPSHSKPHPQRVQLTHNQQAKIQQHTQSQLHPQHHPISQPQPHSQPQPRAQLQQHPQPMNTTAQPQTQHPSSHAVTGQIRNINPAKQQLVHSYAQQPGNTVQQRPLMQAVQQPIPRQCFHHQSYVQQQPPTQLRPWGQSLSFPLLVYMFLPSTVTSPGIQHTQSHLGGSGRPMMPIHGVQSQTSVQTAGGVHMRPVHPAVNLPSTNQSITVRTNDLVQSGANSRPNTSERRAEQESESSSQQIAKNVTHDVGTASAVVADTEAKTVQSEMDIKSIDNENKPAGEDKTNHGDTSSEEIPDIHALENGETVSKSMLNAADQNKVQKLEVARGRSYRGVRQRQVGKFTAEIREKGSRSRVFLGYYDTPEEAALAFDRAAYRIRGPKALLNFPICPHLIGLNEPPPVIVNAKRKEPEAEAATA